MAARTNCHESGGLKQQTFILSQSWRLKTENQGAGRATLSLQTPEKNHSLPLPASGAGSSTWLVAASLQSLPRLRLASFLVWVYVSPPLLKGTRVIGFGAQPNAVQPHLNSLLMSAKTPAPDKVQPEVSDWHEFWSNSVQTLQHCTFLWIFFSGQLRL